MCTRQTDLLLSNTYITTKNMYFKNRCYLQIGSFCFDVNSQSEINSLQHYILIINALNLL